MAATFLPIWLTKLSNIFRSLPTIHWNSSESSGFSDEQRMATLQTKLNRDWSRKGGNVAGRRRAFRDHVSSADLTRKALDVPAFSCVSSILISPMEWRISLRRSTIRWGEIEGRRDLESVFRWGWRRYKGWFWWRCGKRETAYMELQSRKCCLVNSTHVW